MASRIGRKFAQATYPEAARATLSPYARNSAHGPAAPYAVTDSPTRIPWGVLEVGAPGENVPITPNVTGLIRITGVVECVNGSEDAEQLTVQIGVGGVLQAVPLEASFVSGGDGQQTSVPIQAIFGFTVGTTVDISLFVTAASSGDLTLEVNDSWLLVEEVGAATG